MGGWLGGGKPVIKYKQAKGTSQAGAEPTNGYDFFGEILSDWDNKWGPLFQTMPDAQTN